MHVQHALGFRLHHPDEPLVPSAGIVANASVRASDVAVCCTCGCTDMEKVLFKKFLIL